MHQIKFCAQGLRYTSPLIQNNLMKKGINIFAGLAAGLLIVLIINPVLTGISGGIASVLLPLLFSILLVEISVIIAIKKESNSFIIALLVFLVINMGYILVYITAAVISVAVLDQPINNFAMLIKQSGYSYTKQLLIMLVSAVLLFSYLNFVLKRMKNNLPLILKNKNRETGNVKK